MAIIELVKPALELEMPESELAREANHRIANNLTVLLSAVQLKSAAVGKGPSILPRNEVRNLLHEIVGMIASIGHLHHHLSRMPQADDLDAGDFLIESSAAIVNSLSLTGHVGIVERLADRCRVTPEQAQQLGLILSEIVMNAIKYAHPTGVPAQIQIDCRRAPDGGIAIEIADDGVGLPENFDTEKDGGTGIRMIRALAQGLGAKLRIQSDSLGLSFLLVLPDRTRPHTASDLKVV